ncbi:MAG: hypothetical protein DRN78_00080 [Thermoproteota archaeon]|nr:MAG: hypothetical protein DRN78_00080 [Candidatus Korarchaeota archaeon]
MDEEDFSKKCRELGGKVDSGKVGDFKIVVCKLKDLDKYKRMGLWMKGEWYKPKPEAKGKVKKLNSKIIWIANLGNKKIIMTTEEAEKFMKEHPGVSIYAKLKKYELEEHD